MLDVRKAVDGVIAMIPPVDGELARPRRLDVAVSALLAVISLVEFPFLTTPYPGFALAAGLIWATAAAYARVSPFTVVIVVMVVAVGGDIFAAITDEPITGTVAGGLAVIVILYTIGRWSTPITVIGSLLLAGLVIPSTGFLNSVNDPAWASFVVEVAATTTTIVIGLLVRSRDALRTERARSALAEERNHLANDIHDSVAHHMSAIAILAEGASQTTDLERRGEALEAIKQSASTGLTDVRHLISSIRSTDDMPRPLPGFGDLKQLAEKSNNPSLKVDVVIDTAPETVPVTVAAAAYAIAREALTNVRRHATGATEATVRVRSTETYLDLTIVDNGSTPTNGSPDPGFGINVMVERAQTVGGSLSAGPDPTGGWLVASRLPLNSEAS